MTSLGTRLSQPYSAKPLRKFCLPEGEKAEFHSRIELFSLSRSRHQRRWLLLQGSRGTSGPVLLKRVRVSSCRGRPAAVRPKKDASLRPAEQGCGRNLDHRPHVRDNLLCSLSYCVTAFPLQHLPLPQYSGCLSLRFLCEAQAHIAATVGHTTDSSMPKSTVGDPAPPRLGLYPGKPKAGS